MDGEEEEEGSVKVFLAFMKAAHRAIEVIGDAFFYQNPKFQTHPVWKGEKRRIGFSDNCGLSSSVLCSFL